MSLHHHFIDVKSGRIIDIAAELVPDLKTKPGDEYRVPSCHVTFYGELLKKN